LLATALLRSGKARHISLRGPYGEQKSALLPMFVRTAL